MALLRRKKFRISLDLMIYEVFRHLCRRRKLGRANRIIEKIMHACIQNPVLLTLILRSAKRAEAESVSKEVIQS